jgi:predicted dinucleotide-binding enzyme/DNA-binding MarR family transcriptional regulator
MELRAAEAAGEPRNGLPNDLGQQLSFALYGAANRMIRQHKPFLETLGLTFPQYLVLLALLDGAPQTVGALGARLDMDTGTITPLVKRLEAAGMVTRMRDRTDERRVLVDLTDRSRALEAAIRGVSDRIKSACRLTGRGMDDLRRTLEGLAHPANESTTRKVGTPAMKIGIVGAGHIGKTLSRTLSAAGHEVKIANSRGPETIDPDALVAGARAVAAAEAVEDVEVVILSMPLNRMPAFASTLSAAPADAVVIDTSNYYPLRDDRIAAIDDGQVESVWVAEQVGRPIVKAWNAIGSASLAEKGVPAGTPGRIAIPVAADDVEARKLGMVLVEETGFDGFDAGPLSESWRQQPGAPCYCTDLTSAEMPHALASAEKERLPKRRDISIAAIAERVGDGTTNPDSEYAVRLTRAIFL